MNYINKEKDSILSIVKTLKPINYLYSKQNKDFDKFFGSSTLKGLINQIKYQPKFNELLKPGESFEHLTHNKKKDIMDVNYKNTFNYIEELSNLKSLPLVLLKKKNNNNKKITYNCEQGDNKREEKKKNQSKLQLKSCIDIDATLDPGRYHPNYNFIKRRYPCVFLGKPKSKEREENSHKDKNNKNKNNEEKKGDNNKNRSTSNARSNSLGEYLSSGGRTTIRLKTKKNKNKKVFNRINNHSITKSLLSTKNNSNKKIKIKSLNKTKKNNKFKFKEHNTISSWSHTMDLDKPKKTTEKYTFLYDKNKTNYNSTSNFQKTKKNMYRKVSSDNLKCPIIFDKMPGRDRPINFVDSIWDGCRTNYSPDYNIIRPHIPSTIFKTKRIYQNYKKYITGKIIRNYCYNPEQYFVFEIKKDKENEVSGKYGTIMLKS